MLSGLTQGRNSWNWMVMHPGAPTVVSDMGSVGLSSSRVPYCKVYVSLLVPFCEESVSSLVPFQ